jgi:hypothetical protein
MINTSQHRAGSNPGPVAFGRYPSRRFIRIGVPEHLLKRPMSE